MPDVERILETDRLELEPIRTRHGRLLFGALSNPAIYTYIPAEPAASPEELTARFARFEPRVSPGGDEVWLNWAARLKDGASYIGHLQATLPLEGVASIAYLLDPAQQGRGYATEACRGLLGLLFNDWARAEVIAEVDTRNARSIRLLERLGFARIAHKPDADFFKGATSDEYVYRLSREAWEEP